MDLAAPCHFDAVLDNELAKPLHFAYFSIYERVDKIDMRHLFQVRERPRVLTNLFIDLLTKPRTVKPLVDEFAAKPAFINTSPGNMRRKIPRAAVLQEIESLECRDDVDISAVCPYLSRS